MNSIDMLGYEISARGLAGDVQFTLGMLTDRGAGARYVACANPHSLVVAGADPQAALALRHAALLLPDGVGILLAARILNRRIGERVAGNEFFVRFSEAANRLGGISYFFLGSGQLVLDRIVARMGQDFPNIRIAGTLSPPFKESFSEAENAAMIEAVNASGADVLWVGMTAPKQEKWLYEHCARLRVPLAVAIGAVFDFYAGTKQRAPRWVRDLGLEWLPRLLREPARLWRRTLVSSPMFLYDVMRVRLARSAAKSAEQDE